MRLELNTTKKWTSFVKRKADKHKLLINYNTSHGWRLFKDAEEALFPPFPLTNVRKGKFSSVFSVCYRTIMLTVTKVREFLQS